MTFNPKNISTKDLHQHLLSAIAPRPIALASSIDKNGVRNLAPYSFFNAFSSNPPIVVFSSNRRVVDNTTKDTLANIIETQEVVISVVSYAMIRQMAVSSVQFESKTSEFEKSGLTSIDADIVKPSLVKESPVNMECKVLEIKTLGMHGGAGHLIICEVVRMHIKDEVLSNNRINPHKIDLVGRMGRAFYVRASGDAIKTILQPVTDLVIGYDALPNYIKESLILSANHVGMLAGLKQVPNKDEIKEYVESSSEIQRIIQMNVGRKEALEFHAKRLLEELDNRAEAFMTLKVIESL